MVKHPPALIFHNEVKIVYMYIKEIMSTCSIISIKYTNITETMDFGNFFACH